MRKIPLGPVLVFLGVFGGGLLWLVLTGLRFDYLVSDVYNRNPGEAIWALDPFFTITAAIPGISLALIGLVVSFLFTPQYLENAEDKTIHQKLNLFYIGEIGLLVTAIVSFLAFFGISGLTVETVVPSAIVMGIIMVTCIIHILSSAIWKSNRGLESDNLSKKTAILLAVELLVLLSIVITLRLYIWSFIRNTTFITIAVGFLGLAFLIPMFMNSRNENVADVPQSGLESDVPNS